LLQFSVFATTHASCFMSKTSLFIPNRLKPWINARQRFRLSHAHVQMALELGLNPKKFGKLANHRQELWKLPLPEFIAKLYVKRFGKAMPDPVRTIEQMAAAQAAKKQRRSCARQRPAPTPRSTVQHQRQIIMGKR
jgi:hypothetical protein